MTRTVHELRNQIRSGTDRFERDVNSQFTKEELAAIANEVGYAVDMGAPPGKADMQAGIRWKTGLANTKDDADSGGFTKDELVEIESTVNTNDS